MPPRVDVHMRETDAFSWSMESDPRLRMTVVAVALLDGVPPWGEVLRRMDGLTRAVPMFRQRVVPTPGGIASPKWVVDGRFDLTAHVRRIALPAPADADALLAWASTLATGGFDLARPLWEVWLVEGLAEGGSAWVAKVHHTLTDGIGGLELLRHVFDVGGVTRAAPAAAPPPGADGTAALLRGALLHNAHQALTVARGGLAAGARTLRAARRDPQQAAAGALATWRSLLESVAPTGDRLSPVMVGRGLRRRYATVDVPLAALRRAGRAADGTVNDAFLGGVTGGLRRYHELHRATVPELRMTLPIDIREPGDLRAGNRIALIRLQVPILPAEPVARMAEIHRRTGRWKDAPGLAYTEAAYALVNHLPAGYLQNLARHVDFVASNVPGFPLPISLAGPRVRALYAFGPTGGTAVNVTMVSYADTVHVGVDTDADAVPDLDAFVTCLRAGFDEVLALGRPRRAPRPAAVSGR